MLTSIVLSVVVLPGIAFFIVCLVGFHRTLVSESPARAQIECVGTHGAGNSQPAGKSHPLRARSDDRSAA
jgi:hypothetical protein